MDDLLGVQHLTHFEDGSFGQLGTLAKAETLVGLSDAIAFEREDATGGKSGAQSFRDALADPVHAGGVFYRRLAGSVCKWKDRGVLRP